MHKQRSNKLSVFIEDASSSTNSTREVEKEEKEGKETSELEEEKEKITPKISNNKKELLLSSNRNNNNKEVLNETKNNDNKRKQNKMNDNISEEEETESDSSEDTPRKFIRIDSKINIQSNGSKHKGKRVVCARKDYDSTYEEADPNGEGLGTTIRRSNYSKHNLSWLDGDLLEGSDNNEGSEMDNNESEKSSNVPIYERFKRIKESEDEEMNDEESQIPVIEMNGMDDNNNNSNSNNEIRNLNLSHDQFFHPYRLENRIRMIEQTLQRTTWKEHLSETRINRLEAKNYKLKHEYRQLKNQLKKQNRKENDNDDTQRGYSYINPDQQIQNSIGESSNRGISFDYKVAVAGLVGFGLGGLASHYI
ncbi:hypothetical protein C1645_788643 [Glomus cerebriforme]|uniref:Uncharacterized protein n=1 Tax=Glomus cerebriforme TaxID=658196 RepID=A0A397SII7_9GLOM|nr:hypothetical protein C1645_788643 [Glomus cerebriforme]